MHQQQPTGSLPPASPLTVELRRVVRTIAWIALGVGGLFFAISVLLGNPELWQIKAHTAARMVLIEALRSRAGS